VSPPTTPGQLSEGAGLDPPPRLAVGVVTAVFVCIGLIGLLSTSLLPDVHTGALVLSSACVVVLMLTQLYWYASDRGKLRSPVGYTVLGTQAILVYMPVLALGQVWLGTPGFLAGSVLLVLRPAAAWPVFGLVVASITAAQWVVDAALVGVLYAALATVTTGLVVYGLCRLTVLVEEVRASRAEIARMAVLRERLRFARDLHDLLGFSLSAITLKIELTHRLMEKAPAEAANQLLEILEISRLALSDARTVASGYRDMSLEEEGRSALSVLSAADVAVHMDSDHPDLSVQGNTVLATVLREGVTNLLRHSKAKHCAITIRQSADRVFIEIVNDGVRAEEHDEHDGDGLHNLSARAEEIGGSVTAGREMDTFRLRAEVPMRVAHRAARSQPAGVAGDADGVDPVARGQLADDGGEVVTDGAD
jgi:two-component system, NarL family, sensor histidine kinase DesK